LKNYEVDIIIPIYGHAEMTKKCIDSVLATTDNNVRIILIDDCSPGNEIPILFDSYKKIERIVFHRMFVNKGFIGSTKTGAKIGTSPYILFLNSDTESVEKNWIDKLIPKEKETAIVGTKLLYPLSHSQLLSGKVQHAGVAIMENDIIKDNDKLYNIFHIFSGQNANFPKVNQRKFMNTVTGACFLVRRDVWNRLGGWDENFGKGVYEDVDFCWKVSQRGYCIEYNPETYLYHYESAGSLIKKDHPLQKFGPENFQYLMRKWYGMIPLNGNYFYGEGTTERWKKYSDNIINAIACLNKKDFDNAQGYGMECINIAPEFHGGYYVVAICLAKKSYYRESIEFLRASLQANPLFWEARFKLIEEFMNIDEISDANQEFNLLAEIFPDNQRMKDLYIILKNKQK
jgi:GT2 family glycosyltransferase